jgi:hypothetical protein
VVGIRILGADSRQRVLVMIVSRRRARVPTLRMTVAGGGQRMAWTGKPAATPCHSGYLVPHALTHAHR